MLLILYVAIDYNFWSDWEKHEKPLFHQGIENKKSDIVELLSAGGWSVCDYECVESSNSATASNKSPNWSVEVTIFNKKTLPQVEKCIMPQKLKVQPGKKSLCNFFFYFILDNILTVLDVDYVIRACVTNSRGQALKYCADQNYRVQLNQFANFKGYDRWMWI